MTRATRYDLVVAGAGIAGAVVAERAASRHGWRVLVIEHREHVGGNAADCIDEHGILVHRHGPHVFHTNSSAIREYLSGFTEWKPYRHRVEASLDASLVPVPVNFNSIDLLFSPPRARQLQRLLVSTYGEGAEVPILLLRNSTEPIVRRFANKVYEEIFLPYTVKQWGLLPEELDPSVTARVPVRLNRDDSYFTDAFEAIPSTGYSAMIEKILDHPKIDVALGVDFHSPGGLPSGTLALYTGQIDRYFDYKHGPLPYRTLSFQFQYQAGGLVQAAPTVTYPSHPSCTRSCEYRQLTGQDAAGTSRSFEFPGPHAPGETVPYYPIPTKASRAQYQLYAAEAKRARNVVFCGRLGRFQYLNMDQAVGQAMKTAETICMGSR